MENELLHVQNQRPWDPLYYDQSVLNISKAVSNFIILECLAVLALNGAVIAIATRARHLLDCAANVLCFSLCLNNLIFGGTVLVFRIKLAINFAWTERECMSYAILTIFCTANGAMHVLGVCAERYITLVRLKRIPVKKAVVAAASLWIQSAAYMVLHYLEGGKSTLSRSGMYCFPTSFATWIGVANIAIMISCVCCVIGTYAIVYYQLRRVHGSSSSTAFNFPGLGQDTMMALGQGGASLRPSLASARSNKLPNYSSSAQSTSHIKGTATLSLSPNANGEGRTPGENEADTIDKLRGRAISQVASDRANDAQKAEIRVLKRGVFSFVAYSFVYPTLYFVWLGFRYGQRPSVFFDWIYAPTKFISEIMDPIILFTLDRRFKAELRAVFG